jgi:Gnt-I system low-affinity gluconate transporter
MEYQLLLAFLAGISLLLTLILVFKINAFVSLLMGSIAVGLISGMSPTHVIDNIIEGMGNTLGFVAIVVGLGSIIGAILESTGSTEGIARYMLSKLGDSRSRTALSVAGFLIAIPVFFDVAFIILVPMIYALRQKSGRSILYYGLPLLSSLAVTHAFIPPTPGPIAVADILGADLGWIILFGFIVGVPTTIIAGMGYGGFISGRLSGEGYEEEHDNISRIVPHPPPVGLILLVIMLPIFLILSNTITRSIYGSSDEPILSFVQFIGHPIVALIITTLLAMVLLGIQYGASKEQLQKVATRSLGPAGVIILITGAGGVFKQMLVESGAGSMMAEQVANWNVTPVVLSFVLALIVRLLQGSATVAMITAAGIMAPIIGAYELGGQQMALIVLSIAAGATGFSHVNDSGFWLVNKYLGLTEVDTLKSWTIMSGVISITAVILISILYAIV